MEFKLQVLLHSLQLKVFLRFPLLGANKMILMKIHSFSHRFYHGPANICSKSKIETEKGVK